MKLLYTGHTYTIEANQAKIAAIAALPGMEVTLLTPDRWRGVLYSNSTDPFSKHYSQAVKHYPLRAYFVGKESAFFYGGGLFSLINDLQPDIVHVEQGTYALSYAQILLALKRFSPNSKATFFSWWNIPQQLTGFRSILERFNLKHSACAIAGNVEASALIKCSGFDRPIHVIPQLGVSPEIYRLKNNQSLRRELGLEGFVVGYVGRVTAEKGVLDLIEAVGQMKTLLPKMVYILGSGSALQDVKTRAAELKIHLVCTPAVRNEVIPEHLAMIDCLVLPSRTTPEWVEQFGHILIEAMAAHVPVIGSSSGEIPRVINGGGRIFTEGDVAGLAGILDALAENPQLRSKLAASGAVRVDKEFTHQRIAEKQFKVYQWMLKYGKSVGELAAMNSSTSFAGSGAKLDPNV